jgi:membrane peptidoglycan carboxypeptidase
MATAYATIAARGKYCAPTPLLKITDSTGKPLPFADPACKQVIRPEVADAAADAARCPVGDDAVGACTHPGGGDTAVRAGSSIDRPVAGKSGTTDNGDAPGEPTAWFVGFTPNLAAASFIANPAKAVDDVTDYARLPLTVFIGTMKRSLQLLPEKDFVRPPDSLAYGIRVTVPDVRGASLDDAKRQLEDAGFSWRLADNQEGSQYDQGLVARTDPWSGNSATKGGVVTIYVSSGNNGGNPGQGAGQSPGTGDGNQNQPGGGGNRGGGGRRPGGGGPPPLN